VDKEILEKALNNVIKRFPAFRYKLKQGLFWCYFKYNEGIPEIQDDYKNPLLRINFKKNKGFMFRIRYFDKRISIEYFHALTDGTGGITFLLTLAGEYLRIKHKLKILAVIITSLFIAGILSILAVFYIPLPGLRDLRDIYIATAMTTQTHQWLATAFFSEETIQQVMSEGIPPELQEKTKKLSFSKHKENKIELISVSGTGYSGKLLKIPDPSKYLGFFPASGSESNRTYSYNRAFPLRGNILC
jgi:hypothetical protein